MLLALDEAARIVANYENGIDMTRYKACRAEDGKEGKVKILTGTVSKRYCQERCHPNSVQGFSDLDAWSSWEVTSVIVGMSNLSRARQMSTRRCGCDEEDAGDVGC